MTTKRGRRPKPPTKEQADALVGTIATTGSDKDAYTIAGVPPSSFYLWLQTGRDLREQGKRAEKEPLVDFLEKVEKARAARTVGLVKRIRDAGQDPKHWTANAWLLERTDPKRYGQRVRVHVQEELTDAVARLRDAFKDDPAAYEKALLALTGGHSAGGAESDPEGEGGEDDRSGEAVPSALPKPEAIEVSGSDV